MSIYIVTHKEYEFSKSDDYAVIQVGNIFNAEYLNDSVGENIANKNKNYCELTALYWLWKNSKDDFIGLVHYRRYFYGLNQKISIKGRFIATEEDLKINAYEGIIVPSKQNLDMCVYKQWATCHYFKDWMIIGRLIRDNYPEYLNAYYEVSESNKLYLYNMFYMKKDILNEYCAWLFELLSLCENHVDLKNYSDYQVRFYGFASERLFNVWLAKKNYILNELDVVALEDTSMKNMNETSLVYSIKLKIFKNIKKMISMVWYRAFKIGLI